MSTSSADPAQLEAFTTGVAAARAAAEDRRSDVGARQRSVYAASPDHRTSVPALRALATALGSMGANEVFVATVRRELLAADVHGGGGVVTIGDVAIDAALRTAGVGAPPATVTFQATTSVGLAPTSGFVDDPICAANGNMVHQDTDVSWPAIAGALTVTRTWNSLARTAPGAFGAGWRSVLDVRLDVGDDAVDAHLPDGAVVSFARRGDRWVSTDRRGLALHRLDGSWELRTDDVRTFRFDAGGALDGWDVGVARVRVARRDDRRIVGLHESVTGRSLAVTWEGAHVDSLETDDGRTIAYRRDGGGRILEARSHAGALTYRWADDLLVGVDDADGVAAFANVYDDDGRVLEQVSPFGRVTSYRYEPTGLTVVSGDDGVRQAMIHDRRGNLTAVVDSDGSAMRLTYDADDRVIGVVERDGAEWRYTYDDAGDLVARTDPDGGVQRWSWDGARRLLTETDRAGSTWRYVYETDHRAPNRVVGPDGSSVSQRLDERGLPLEITDADGVTTHHGWDRDGQLLSTTDALGGASTLVYDDRGLLSRLVPATGEPTDLTRDRAGRVVRSRRGDEVSSYRYTPAGRITGGSEPGDVAWSATFGPHGAVASVTDATGASVGFAHDAMGNVVAVTAPDGAVYRNRYDDVGRHVATVEPSGATVEKGLDRRGRLVTFTDADGRRWRRELDVLGRTMSSTGPDGAVTRWTYHPNGEIASVRGPDGRTWRCEIDHEGRPTTVVSPTGARSALGYSPAGRLRWRRSPAGRTERFAYDAAGRLAAMVGIDGVRRSVDRDLRGRIVAVDDGERTVGFEWDDGYRLLGVTSEGATTRVHRDAAGRPIETVDPSGAATTYEWDARGLLAAASDPAGLATRYERDVRGRLVAHTAPGDRRIGLGYGVDGRLASVTDPTGAVTGFGRDLSGNVTGVRHGDGSGWDRVLDAAGREVARTGSDGVVHARYAYDDAGRLATATAEGGLATSFLWDDDDRVAEVTTPGGTTIVERDGDGWVTATTSPAGVRTEYVRDRIGRIVTVRDGEAGELPVDRSPDDVERDVAGRITIGADGTVHRYDDAGRIVEVAPSHGPATTFEYGVDGLVDVERGPAGVRRFAYDAAGRVTAVRVDGVGTTTIAHDPAGRRVREDRPDGSVVTFAWDALGRLASIGTTAPSGALRQLDVGYDAFDRPVVAGTTSFGYDAVSGRLDRVDRHRFIDLGARRYDVDAGTWEAPTPERPAGGVPVAAGLWVLGARVLDTATHQFLSPDPLLAVAGTNGAASAYTYAWHDPVNRVDPTGLRPISIAEYDAIRTREEQGRFGQAWEAIKDDPWGTLAAVGVVALGVGLLFVPGGQAIGVGILVGAAMSGGVGFATGNFSPTGMAVGGAFGAIPGGNTLRGALTIGAASGAAETYVTSALTGQGLPSGQELLLGTATGGAGGGVSHGLTRLFPSGSTPNLDHDAAVGPAASTAPTSIDDVAAVVQAPAASTMPSAHPPVGNVDRVITETLRGNGNLTSAHTLTADEALDAGVRFLGDGYTEIGKPNSGVFRSADGARQFRIDNGSLLGTHPPGVPHVHLETYAPRANRPTANNHVPFVD